MQRLADLREPPVVGRFYMVPAVQHIWCGVDALWPVLGPMHTDADFFNFRDRHYHIDARFVPARLAGQVTKWGKRSIAAMAQGFPLSRRRYDERDIPSGRPTLARFKCQSAEMLYSFGGKDEVRRLREHHGDNGNAAAMPICKPDGRKLCPHRKVDLSSFAPDQDGIVTCPLHGLRVRVGEMAAA
jgi:hypothetical protein